MPTLTTPRRRTIASAALIGLVALALISWWIVSRDTTGDSTPGFETRTMQAGAVEVQVTPMTLNEFGATFQLTLDTHTVDLNLDPATAARLRVNSQPAAGAAWQGPGPGGHHREGTLRFTTPVASGATVELRITGLGQEVAATWIAP